MKVPTKLRYGLRFMINLASHYGSGELISITTISKEEEISNKYLEQIISSFVTKSYIKGSRGKGGGYELLVDPKSITAYDIANALGEDFTFVKCVADDEYCKRKPNCPIISLWTDISENVINVFKTKTLFSLTQN